MDSFAECDINLKFNIAFLDNQPHFMVWSLYFKLSV